MRPHTDDTVEESIVSTWAKQPNYRSMDSVDRTSFVDTADATTADLGNASPNRWFSFVPMKNRLKTVFLKWSYWLAYRFAAPAVYSRQPFVRYPYMNGPSEIIEVTKQLLSLDIPGAAVEIGCNQGWTTCFLLEAMLEQGVEREYVCIDTFTGFTREDVNFEYENRGKTNGMYDDNFIINDPRWLDASMRRFGYSNVRVHKADAKSFDYQALGQIAFALIDVDLYRPVKESLERIFPQMARGGVILIDDCGGGEGGRWDGAYQAFEEFCEDRGILPRIVCQKIGIIRT